MGGQLGKAIERLGSTGRLVMVAIALATVGAMAYLVMSAGPASYVPAYTNLDAKQAGELEAALAGAKIPSRLSDDATTVLVPGSMLDRARVVVAKSNLSASGNDDYHLLDKLPLSTTDQQFGLLVQRATAGTLETSIERIQGIRSARIVLALPKDSVFTEDQRQPTASVLLDTGGGQLPDETVNGIVGLVASGVPGLTADHVTITNERGELLSSTQNGIGSAAAGRLSTEAAWNRRMTGKAQALLDTIVGAGKARVVVTGTLNFDAKSETSQRFEKSQGALVAKTEKEKLSGPGAGAGGGAGAQANVPGTPAKAQGSTGSQYDHQSDSSTNAVPTTVTKTTFAEGDPKNISIALALTKEGIGAMLAKNPKQLAPADVTAARASLENQVKQAVGFAQAPGSTIQTTVAERFVSAADALKAAGVVAGAAPPASGGPIAQMLGPFGVYLKPALALVGLLAPLSFVRKSLRRRQDLLATTDASWLPALEAPPIKIEDLMPAIGGPSEAELAGHQKKQMQARIEELAAERPSDVAMQLRSWLSAAE